MSDRLALAHAFVEGSAATKADVQGAEARLKKRPIAKGRLFHRD